jgi:hypothetical protein
MTDRNEVHAEREAVSHRERKAHAAATSPVPEAAGPEIEPELVVDAEPVVEPEPVVEAEPVAEAAPEAPPAT